MRYTSTNIEETGARGQEEYQGFFILVVAAFVVAFMPTPVEKSNIDCSRPLI